MVVMAMAKKNEIMDIGSRIHLAGDVSADVPVQHTPCVTHRI
jgi:hypothetical protein